MNVDDFRSDEEWWFYLWCREAYKLGLLKNVSYETETFTVHQGETMQLVQKLKTKIKLEEKNLYTNTTKVEYTPDFRLELTDAGIDLLAYDYFARGCQADNVLGELRVDVKGSVSKGSHGNKQVFFLKQRLLWDTHGIYVQECIPTVSRFGLFSKTFAPDSLRWMKGRKAPTLNKVGRKSCTAQEWFDKNAWKLREA